ncbi:MAG: hypothetical protein A2W22_05420 [Candidatus Levybacteria bacterium RBG_16_35_11]|nr:MAG: hypothetical protein A2W22_05420 [Candidatus Levybacteria bacterium RBG_16_35_11]
MEKYIKANNLTKLMHEKTHRFIRRKLPIKAAQGTKFIIVKQGARFKVSHLGERRRKKNKK